MTVFEIIGKLLLGPLLLLFEIIFRLANDTIGHPGLAIIALSLMMNLLVLPLYRRADAMQEETRNREEKLRKWTEHIKKHFTGDEKMMILQTYYRQNHYSPLSALNGSVSLLLEIPFFMTAYQFLSKIDIMNGVSLGPIADLGTPDGMIVIGNAAINLLPILMTAINVISSVIYLKGHPLKTKIQVYGLALFFLVFLYNSPSCLVFYWTLNNVFSLVKNIFYKFNNPKKVLFAIFSLTGGCLLFTALFVFGNDSYRLRIYILILAFMLQLPALWNRMVKRWTIPRVKINLEYNKNEFMLGALFLVVLTGLLIPSAFLASSPQEYIHAVYFHHPLWYLVSTLSLAAGTFVIWMGVFYWLASPAVRSFFDKIIWIAGIAALVDYMFFGTNLGVISSTLQYEKEPYFTGKEMIINILIIAIIVVACWVLHSRLKKIAVLIMMTGVLALGLMSGINVIKIKDSIDDYLDYQVKSNEFEFTLSKNGKNIIVIMLDRAMGEYIPYLFNEKPELKEQFAGFTHYNNTISFGGYTNFGTPALFGGYEYTPVEMNKREEETLREKHNEALKVMPVLFDENGFEVTVCDLPYGNYQWNTDLSIFDEYTDINTHLAEKLSGNIEDVEKIIDTNNRNFFCLSLMKVLPLPLQKIMYNGGLYNQIEAKEENNLVTQVIESKHTAKGRNESFESRYQILAELPDITHVSDETADTFLVMVNSATHEPTLLQTPDYVPALTVDNSEYDKEQTERFILGDKQLIVETEFQMASYHSNMAVMLQIGNWLDYLRANDVYDNTRIILVADHGRDVRQIEELVIDWEDSVKNIEGYYPLLMVKDFGSEEFTTSEEFMTNADVPTLAMKDVIIHPKNPFTGKEINSDEKNAHEQFVILSTAYIIDQYGKQFPASEWASVKDNLWEKTNWSFSEETAVLEDYVLP